LAEDLNKFLARRERLKLKEPVLPYADPEELEEVIAQQEQITNKQWNDFITTSTHPWIVNSINAGTWSGFGSILNHNGIRTYSSSANANSGYFITTNTISFILMGGEKTTFIFKTPLSQASITRRMGFHTTQDSNSPTDGIYAKIVNGVIAGETSNNNEKSATNTTYTLSADTWYRLKIELNQAKTLVTYTLYADNSDSVLWTNTISTNIPTARVVGHGDVVTSSGTTAIALGQIDYMDIIIPNARKV
jgi:hypothetical protein